MIQDIAPRILYNHYVERQPEEESVIVVFCRGELLFRQSLEGNRLELPLWKEMPETVTEKDIQYLFSIDEVSYFLLESPLEEFSGYTCHSLRSILELPDCPNDDAMAAFTAFHLWEWYTSNRYCGACGHRTQKSREERALCCPSCGHTIYPRINPAVIIGVLNGDRILVTRYRTGYGHNALIAGFTEIGETLEETVAREVMEEAGVKVKNIRYYKSQPWGIAQDILVGFYCEVDGDDTIRMDTSELKYAEWVKREDLVLQPSEYSLTNEMMMKFRDEGILL